MSIARRTLPAAIATSWLAVLPSAPERSVALADGTIEGRPPFRPNARKQGS